MRLLAPLFILLACLPLLANGQARTDVAAIGGGEDNATCSRSFFALDPENDTGSGDFSRAATESETELVGTAIQVLRTENDCGVDEELEPPGTLTCFRESDTYDSAEVIGNPDPLNEWGECSTAGGSLGPDGLLMQWDRSGGGTATFQVQCTLTILPGTPARHLFLSLEYAATGILDIGGRFGFAKQYFQVAGFGTGEQNISIAGVATIDSGDCIGIRAHANGDVDLHLLAAACSVVEVSECTQTAP